RTGEGDATALLSTALFAEAGKDPNLVAEPKSILGFEAIYMNRTRSQLGDVRVRQAIAYAIDRNALVAGVLGGLGEPQYQPFPKDYYAYNSELPADPYPYDPEKAKALLKEAGLEGGFSFEMVYPAYNEPSASAVKAMLAKVGIDVAIRAVEPAAIA